MSKLDSNIFFTTDYQKNCIKSPELIMRIGKKSFIQIRKQHDITGDSP